GPEGRPLAIGEAATAQFEHLVGKRGDELLGKAALADPGRPEHQDQRAARLGHRLLEQRAKPVEFVLAADDRRVESPHDPGSFHAYVEEAEGGHSKLLALEGERLDPLDAHGVAHETERVLSEEYLAVLRRLLQAL